MHRGVDARVHRDPLHPRIEVLLLLRGIGREYARLIVEALEVRKPAFVYELRDQRRSQFVELEQYDLALLRHDRPLAADPIHSPSHDGVVELAPPVSQESSQPSCTAGFPGADDAAIHLHQGVPAPLVRKLLFDGSPRLRAKCLRPLAIARQLHAGVRQRPLVPWLDEQAGCAMRDELRDPANGGGDDRCPERHRFQERHRNSLVE